MHSFNVSKILEQRKTIRGISYAELSRRTGINEDMVSRFCKGTSKPSGEQLIRLCTELELEIEDFLAEDPIPAKTEVT